MGFQLVSQGLVHGLGHVHAAHCAIKCDGGVWSTTLQLADLLCSTPVALYSSFDDMSNE